LYRAAAELSSAKQRIEKACADLWRSQRWQQWQIRRLQSKEKVRTTAAGGEQDTSQRRQT
jgi:hypothetical protein